MNQIIGKYYDSVIVSIHASLHRKEKDSILKSAINWDNRLFLQLKKHVIRDSHALMMFNLHLCAKPFFKHVYLCPDGCFGRRNKNTKLWELGNPCENATNTRTDRCFPVGFLCY